MGFGPQVVDLDADGHSDLISGDWIGRIIFFRGTAAGSFLPGEPVNGSDGKAIKIDYGVYSFAHDWDADGDYDLVAGTVDGTGQGNVYLLTNDGTPTAHKFGKPTKVLAAGREIFTPEGDAAPVVADWDGDDRPDLIIGCGDGSVIWYQNVGSRQSPQFLTAETLLPPPKTNAERGMRSKVCVTDWNEDGQMDLLVGDFGRQFDKVLSEEEKRWREDARQRQEEFFSTWARTFQDYRALLRQSGTNAEGTKQNEFAARLAKTRKQLVQLKQLRNRYYEEEQALQPGKQYHGRLWLYLGGTTTAAEKTGKSREVAKDSIPIDEPTAGRPVTLASQLSSKTAKPGSEITLTVRVRTATDWHIYAVNSPGRTRMATKLTLELPSHFTAREEWVLPNSEAYASAEPYYIYRGDITFRRRLTVSSTAPQGRAVVKCKVAYQACDESVCLPPTTDELLATLEVVPE